MNEFCLLILVSLFATNSPDKAESVQLEELPLQTFDELFVEEWWDNDKAEDLKWPPTNFGQNVHQIDRQNTQIGQIEPNSIDQNPFLTESDHSDNAINGKKQNEIIKEITSNEKRKIVDKFHAMKDEFKQKGKFLPKEWVQIEKKIAKHLKVNRKKIYKWKKEFGLCQKVLYATEERKHLVEKFDQRKAELMRAGITNSQNELDKTVAKELGRSFVTIYNWKRQLGQSTPNNKYSHNEQKELLRRYYEIKDETPKISDRDIAKMLKIGRSTLYKWKRQFKRQQLHPNSVEGHFLEENFGPNIQGIENINLGSI